VYDNDSTDNLKQALEPFIQDNLVEYNTIEGDTIQFRAYNLANEYAKEQKIDWMLFVDIDEYLTLVGDTKHCVHDFLAPFDKPGVGGIVVNR
jgi:hypothetical protein